MNDPYVYFIEFPEVGCVKIGYTTDLEGRMVGLASWLKFYNPHKDQEVYANERYLLLKIKGGTPELEKAFHYRYRKHLMYGREGFKAEWVIPTISAIDPHQVLAEYRARPAEEPWPADEVTERFPVGFVRRERTQESIAYVIKANEELKDAVLRLKLGTEPF